MKLSRVLGVMTLVAVGSSSAYAANEFSYTSTGPPMLIPTLPSPTSTEGITVVPLTMSAPLPGNGHIDTLNLTLNGLTHSNAGDLDIYLIDPFGTTLEIMTDHANGQGLANATLRFSDLGALLPSNENDPINPDTTYKPEGTPPGFGLYHNGLGGTDAWILLLIDDTPGDTGSITSYTLSGTAVPEPMTLSLLALGAFATLRRRK
ncbi:MAG: PEP-CTERM sorting domain-containing protein [Planctomycetes bacterium]|nr:PEP-CTERM sorting domain-containing protein [Planctomycetota bacterium]